MLSNKAMRKNGKNPNGKNNWFLKNIFDFYLKNIIIILSCLSAGRGWVRGRGRGRGHLGRRAGLPDIPEQPIDPAEQRPAVPERGRRRGRARGQGARQGRPAAVENPEPTPAAVENPVPAQILPEA